MKFNGANLIVSIAFLVQAAGAQEGRETATTEYTETVLRRFVDEKRPPVDPAIAMEGVTVGAQPGDLPPGYVIFEGDIQVRVDDLDALMASQTRAAFGGIANFWGNIVPYDFAANVSAANQQAAINAMNAIGARTGVTFRPLNATDFDWIRFNASTVNNSAVGRQGGIQFVNILNWGNQFIIIHEVYHALGFWHQQAAADRNTYVTINNANICGSNSNPGDPCNANVCQSCQDSNGNWVSCAFQFSIVGGGLYGPYDFDSFMHYGRSAFSCNGGDTISVNSPWNTQWQNFIGQRDHFSLIDELACRGIYPYPNDRWLRAGASSSNAGTFFNPFIGTFAAACNSTPANGTLLIDPGTYSGVGTYSQVMIIRGTYGLATIGS
jgi:hypothetical protein